MRTLLALLLIICIDLTAHAQQRFDNQVRDDMFAGMDGDTEAFDRAMKLIADTLARQPEHPEALVWRGDGELFQAGQAFRRGAFEEGRTLTRRGLADMERAVALAPNEIAVRVPRATGLQPFARGMRTYDRAESDRLMRIAMGDFEFVVTQSAPYWTKLAPHNRGELLGALADGWLALGDTDRANGYLDRMIIELPDTPYAKAATQRRADPSARTPLTCLSCH